MSIGVLNAPPLTPGKFTAEKLMGLNFKNAGQLIHAIEQGFSFNTLERVRRETGLPMNILADSIGISPRTLTRRKKEKKLTSSESDRLVSLSRLLTFATELFAGSTEKALRWFVTPSPALGNVSPIEMAATNTGAREVESLIGRLEHGVFS
ncbi:MAG: antitoxin Xre/MbcA/ParS toxin-binding domain-containing protein [Pyrinomonadaceae bacterium]